MQKAVALDANVLVLLIVGLTDVRYIARHKRVRETYRTEHYDVLRQLIAGASALATTTHALTEASNLLRQCADPMKSEIMAHFARAIKSSAELTPAARQAAAAPEFLRLGLTDAAFTLLDPKRYRVVSADLDLILALERRGVEVANFHNILFD